MPAPGKFRGTGCPIAFALDTFGDRWTLLIMRDMMMMGHRTYGEFLGAKEKIATNILADRLKFLENTGIIIKARDPENRRRNIYSPTKKGWDLIPIILELARWSAKHDPGTVVPKKILRRIENDRDGFIADIRNRFKA